MRAVLQLVNAGYINIPGDEIKKDGEWFIVKADGKLVGMFDEGEVKTIHLSDKKQKEDANS
ncbi:MAG: hypothetical protein ACI4SB_04590 [Acutalibacteraceae bacterium]